jgi:hypothetical protein
MLKNPQTGLYFAVNVRHVQDVVPHKVASLNHPVSLIHFGFTNEKFTPLAFGKPDEIHALLKQATKIGLGKVEVQVLTGQKGRAVNSMILNHPERIAMMREMEPEEIAACEVPCTTASYAFFGDGTERIIIGRPGTFAYKVNAENKVPVWED